MSDLPPNRYMTVILLTDVGFFQEMIANVAWVGLMEGCPFPISFKMSHIFHI